MLIGSALTGVAVILVGVCMLVWPRRFWYVTQGWWSYDNPRDVRLSAAYLVWNVIQAVSVIAAGLAALLTSLLRGSG
jgi:hypothetical protein